MPAHADHITSRVDVRAVGAADYLATFDSSPIDLRRRSYGRPRAAARSPTRSSAIPRAASFDLRAHPEVVAVLDLIAALYRIERAAKKQLAPPARADFVAWLMK